MYSLIPQELKSLRQWVCWKAIPDDSRPGKIKKIPINALTGGRAMSNKPQTWCNFEAAAAISAKFSGIGFMFANGYFGVDLDDIADELDDYNKGAEDNLAGEFIHGLGSYSEYSVSGKGIHILCKGKLPEGGRRKGKFKCMKAAGSLSSPASAWAPMRPSRIAPKPSNPCTKNTSAAKRGLSLPRTMKARPRLC